MVDLNRLKLQVVVQIGSKCLKEQKTKKNLIKIKIYVRVLLQGSQFQEH